MNFAIFAQGVIINVFLLLGFVALFAMVRHWLAARFGSVPDWANGFLFGAMAVVAMLVPSTVGPGVIFDCRSGVIGAAAILGGPLTALFSVPLPCLYRLYIAGAGVVPGLLEIIVPAVLGTLCYCLCHSRAQRPGVRKVIFYSLVVGLCANGLILSFILAFMARQHLLLGLGSSVLMILLNGPVAMALFSTLLVIAQQYAENAEINSSILQTAMDGYWLTDTRGCLLEVNETYCRMSGYSEAELLSKRISDIEASQTSQQIAGRIQKITAEGGERFESRHSRKNGTVFDVEVSARHLPIAGGRLVSFVRDITERKKAEEARQESEKKYKLLIETTNTGFVILDDKGRVLDANQEYVRMTGNPSLVDICGRPVTDWTAPYDLERSDKEVRTCLQTGSVRNLEIDYVDTHGKIVPIEIHGSVLAGGQTPQIMTVCRDISERRLAVMETERLHAQLAQAQKMESVGRLAGGVAHDFNNMLSVIMGWADMARLTLPREHSLRDTFEHIMDAAQRSANLTRQLLAFARKQVISPRVLDLNETVESMLKMLRRIIGENIQLVWKPAAGLGTVFIDPVQLDQILANICVNSRDAIGENVGKISIETGMVDLGDEFCHEHSGLRPGRHVLLAVSDDGCGMDSNTLSRVFEPFFTTKEVGKGTGLGLATVYGIVKQNNGSIEFASEPGRGSTCRIYLPHHQAKTVEDLAQTGATKAPHGNETILLVEDEPAVLQSVQMMLTALDYNVLPAATPTEALRIARDYSDRVHLLVTDVIMPEMNGRDLARALQTFRPGLKHLFMSGHTADLISHHGMPDEGISYLQKPFLVEELATKVRAALES